MPLFGACERHVTARPARTVQQCCGAELNDVEPRAPHPACALSSARMKRFNDRSQPSMATLFKKRAAQDTAGDQCALSAVLCEKQSCGYASIAKE